jgi:hypothetical protein
MLAEHAKALKQKEKQFKYSFCGLEYVVWDWLCLGVFTGSGLAEYAQSGLRKKQRFQTIPQGQDLGKWAGSPLEFLTENFMFFYYNDCCIWKRHHEIISSQTDPYGAYISALTSVIRFF